MVQTAESIKDSGTTAAPSTPLVAGKSAQGNSHEIALLRETKKKHAANLFHCARELPDSIARVSNVWEFARNVISAKQSPTGAGMCVRDPPNELTKKTDLDEKKKAGARFAIRASGESPAPSFPSLGACRYLAVRTTSLIKALSTGAPSV